MVSSGTSMAAPHVTGVASLLWQKDLSCSSDFIRKLLALSANLYGDREEYGYGLIDLEYALEQYDAFKAVYTENEPLDDIIEESQEDGDLLDNTSEIITFDDVDYVVGSWDSTAHNGFPALESYESHNPLSENGIKIVKLAAIISDKELPGFDTYPQFHGFMSKKVGTPTYQSNYIASYIYLTNKAVGLYNSTTPSAPAGLSSYDKSGIDTYLTTSSFNGKTWTTLLAGNTVNATNKALFVYGIAMHSVTDLYAHSTYDKDGNYIDHKYVSELIGADTPSVVSNRFECAEVMAQILIAHIKRFESGDISDFYTVANVPYDWSSFKLGRLSTYAQQVNSSYYNTYKDVFDIMNINK
ncbi:S8 family serine peptidase [Anaerocolumna sedimenticola]|uniref:S8 family serine peptidase n=1 Tax=Anaerocolumna sedimenticola TaxID=2696063 RepID=A0A6P1TIP6_9FIRM|nr:S8 family serine peptidase [Anaerocolumna sedimenticola]QHQ59505.1 S8 family serine peptidase [Anaerocolumna sedimenticola]